MSKNKETAITMNSNFDLNNVLKAIFDHVDILTSRILLLESVIIAKDVALQTQYVNIIESERKQRDAIINRFITEQANKPGFTETREVKVHKIVTRIADGKEAIVTRQPEPVASEVHTESPITSNPDLEIKVSNQQGTLVRQNSKGEFIPIKEVTVIPGESAQEALDRSIADLKDAQKELTACDVELAKELEFGPTFIPKSVSFDEQLAAAEASSNASLKLVPKKSKRRDREFYTPKIQLDSKFDPNYEPTPACLPVKEAIKSCADALPTFPLL